MTPSQETLVCVMTAYLLLWCSVLCAIWLLSEKDIVWPFNPTPWVKGVSQGKIFATIAASVVSFHLICNMTIFWKSLILASAPPPKSTQQTRTQAFKLKSRLICFISIAALPACKISAKSIINCLSYCELKIFYLWPLRWGQRGWGKTLTLPCLSTGTWQSWSIVRMC